MGEPIIRDTIEAGALQAGDHAAYERLFVLWHEPLCRYACSILRNMDEAEEVVQRTFCKLWDSRNTLEIRTSIKSYLYRMVHNQCLNRIQQLKTRAGHHEQYAYTVPDSSGSAAGKVIAGELEQQIMEAVAALPPQCKRVFELSRYKQLSYAEIAAEMSISTNTVENHLSKALRLLRENLKDYLPLVVILFILKWR